MFQRPPLLLVLLGLSMLCAPNVLLGEERAGDVSTQQSDAAQRPGIVKIATIGALPSSVDAAATFDEMVQHVVNHWKSRFAEVLPDRPDLIVVPEACDASSGLSEKRLFAYYEARGNRVQNFFASVAKENHCYLTYPAVVQQQDGTWRNSITLLDREGNVAGVYSKNHPTIGEIDQGIVPGLKTPIIQCDFGRVALAICFDLNFDDLRLEYAQAQPDLIVFCSAYHGGLMQPYWAYSCRSYFVGAVYPPCHSEIYNPVGELVASTTNYFDFLVATVNLDSELAHLDYNGARLTALKQKYGPAVTITDPGRLGSVLITSSHASKSVQAMIDEFDIERLDDYLSRALEYRNKQIAAGKKAPTLPTKNSVTAINEKNP